MRKKILAGIIITLLLHTANTAIAQPYNFSLGLRGGIANGITGKYFISEGKAIEGILTSRWRGFALTGLYEIQKETNQANLFWFYGFGAHIASYKSYYYYGYNGYYGYYHKGRYYTSYYSEPVTVLGIDGIIGLEYKFEAFPFTIGIDTKPFFDLFGNGGHYFDTALTARYIFK